MSRRDRPVPHSAGTAVGPLRIDASVRSLARRLHPGDIAVIDLLDLDRTSAEALAAHAPAAVLNIQSSISGRYPAGGASVLAAAGIPLVDGVDSALLTLRDGTVATVDFAGEGRDTVEGADAAPASPDPIEPAAEAAGTPRRKPGKASAAPPVQDAVEKPSPVDADKPADAEEAPATTGGIGGWWRERSEQRTARKRAGMTWLDELRELDGDDEPLDRGVDASAASAAPEAKAAPDGHRARPDGKAVATHAGPRRAAISAGGLELSGTVMDEVAVEAALAEAASGMATQLAVFTANAMDVVDRSGGALLEGEGLPDLGVDVQGRHVIVIAPGFGAASALRSIKHYVRDRKPIVIAVGEAAEIARKARSQPAVVIGATTGLSDATLSGARKVIAHGPEGADVGESRLGALKLEHASSDVAIASEDLALLLARAGGAETIVTVGVEATLLDFLESGRVETAGTFLARLSAGSRLVDARTVASLYRPRWSGVVILAAVILAVIALVAALWANADSRAWIQDALTAMGVSA